MYNNDKLSIKQMQRLIDMQFDQNNFDMELLDGLCVLLEKFAENCSLVFADYIDDIPSHDLSIIVNCMNQCMALRELLDHE